METFPALLAICVGNSPVPGEFPAQRLVTRSSDVFFDLRHHHARYDVTVMNSAVIEVCEWILEIPPLHMICLCVLVCKLYDVHKRPLEVIVCDGDQFTVVCHRPFFQTPKQHRRHFLCISMKTLYDINKLHLKYDRHHDDVIKWKHFPRYWQFVRGIHRFPRKSQWRGALMFSLICVWINDWVNNHEAGDLRRYRAYYDVIVMVSPRTCRRLLDTLLYLV